MPLSRSTWINHFHGLERLFTLRGSQINDWNTTLDQDLLTWCRPLMIIAAFFTQQPSIMRLPEWKAIAVLPKSDEGLSSHRGTPVTADMWALMDVLAEIPALYQVCNKQLENASQMDLSSSPIDLNSILMRVRQLQDGLLVWESQWECSHLVYEHPPGVPLNSAHGAQTQLWTTSLYFDHPESAYTFNMYHSIIILLASITTEPLQAAPLDHQILGSGILDRPSTRTNVPQPCLPNITESIHSICRSVEYYLRILQPSQAPPDYYLFFPIHVARRASLRLSRSSELACLDNATRSMKARFSNGVWAKMDFGDRFNGSKEGLFG